MSGCVSFKKNEPEIRSDFCPPLSIYFRFDYSEKNKTDLKKSGQGIKQYVQLNETANACYCKILLDEQLRCFKRFDDLYEKIINKNGN